NTVAAGTTIYRLSHPLPVPTDGPLPQQLSESVVDSQGITCDSWPRPQHLYSTRWLGGVYGGSSGAAAMLSTGQVVGQLHGGCGGFDPGNGCDDAVEQADGAFATTYPYLVTWLEGHGGGGGGTAPGAGFTLSPSSPIPGPTVQFTDTSTGSPTSWSWDFGDGAGSNDRNPAKVYSNAGSYNVTLTVSNALGSNTAYSTVVVQPGGPACGSATSLC